MIRGSTTAMRATPNRIQVQHILAPSWLAVFFVLTLLLPPLPLAMGSSGPHLAVLAAAAGLWIGLRRFAEWRWELDTLSFVLLALFAILLASVVQAARFSGGVTAVASIARVLLFGISPYVFLYIRQGPSLRVKATTLIRVMFWAAVVSALYACIDFYFQFPALAPYGPQFLWLQSGVFRRAQGVFYDAGMLGNLSAFFLVMIAAMLLLRRGDRPLPLPALLAGGVVLASALTLSFSRSSLINLGVALVALVWLGRRCTHLGKVLAGLTLVAGITAGALFFAVPLFAKIYWQRIVLSVQYFVQSPNSVLAGRLHTWALLRDFLLAHPGYALGGVGYKTLSSAGIDGKPVIADNEYLSALVETGVLGFAAVIVLNVTILVTAYRAAQSGGPRAFFGTWIFCFWAGQSVQMLSVDLLTYWRVLPLYFCVLALATRKERDEDPVS